MNVAILAYGEMGAGCLETLLSLPGCRVVGVATHPDDPAERIWFRSVKEIAEAAGVPVRLPEDPNDPAFVGWLREIAPDLLLSLYFRQVLKRPALSVPRVAALNLHGSLLPRYRGRAPTNWAVLHGETETGVTLHHMIERPDAGDIVAQARVPIGPEETAHEVFARQVAAAKRLLADIWPRLVDGTAPRIPQDHSKATTFGRRRPEDGRIDWSWSAKRVVDLVRAVAHPYPGAFTALRGRRLYVWSARPAAGKGEPGEVLACGAEGILVAAGEGAVLVRACQGEGEPEMPAAGFHERHALRPGERAGGGEA